MTKMAKMAKMCIVLVKEKRRPVEYVCFVEEANPVKGTEVILGRDAWEEMGKPDEVTVTVEPGDKLNGVRS